MNFLLYAMNIDELLIMGLCIHTRDMGKPNLIGKTHVEAC
jgi:hypothetical protein